MRDSEYKVGDVIAFRVTDVDVTRSKMGNGVLAVGSKSDNAFIYRRSTIPEDKQAILERIPNPKLMEGEWWKGWTWERRRAKSGEVVLFDELSRQSQGGELDVYDDACDGGCRIVLIPPPSGPCPELKAKLKAKIEKMEAELAELKKQALG